MRFGFSGPRIGFFRPWVSFQVGGRSRVYREASVARSDVSACDFAYVIRNENGHHKVGVSNDPAYRRGQLQTGSSTLLNVVWSTPVFGNAYAIENEAKFILRQHQLIGEWFGVPAEAAIGAVYAAAYRQGVTLDLPPDGVSARPRFFETFGGKLVLLVAVVILIAIAQAIF